ncbi:MAG: aldo/keto reductase [Bacteroidota bacterium]
MKYRSLGNTGEKLSAIGLGCMGMSFAYGEIDIDEAKATLSLALELGINFWDTADMYGFGANEELLAPYLKANRKDIFIATKFGFRAGENGSRYFDGRPEYMKQAVEASLKRLGTDVIDLYYAHRIDDKVPVEEMVGAMAELVQQGKVKYIGLSEAAAATLHRANKVHQITALQSEYSLNVRDVEAEILPACRELGITFVPYSPLGRGLFGGTITDTENLAADDFRRTLPRFQAENFAGNKKQEEAIARIAAELGISTPQLALAWLLAQGEDIIPIPGTKKRRYLRDNAGAADVVLSNDTLNGIEKILKEYKPQGGRYSEFGMAMVNR